LRNVEKTNVDLKTGFLRIIFWRFIEVKRTIGLPWIQCLMNLLVKNQKIGGAIPLIIDIRHKMKVTIT
jgi:hypothetical protein